jgi:hypothetical protein
MTRLGWPAAFLLSVMILAAVFTYVNLISLGINSSNVIVPSGEQVWQLRDGQVRRCRDIEQYGSPRKTNCSQWSQN